MIVEGKYINGFTKSLEEELKDGYFDPVYFRPYCLKEYGQKDIYFRVPGYTVGYIELEGEIISKIVCYARGINVFKLDSVSLEKKLSDKFLNTKFEWGILWKEYIKDFDEDK